MEDTNAIFGWTGLIGQTLFRQLATNKIPWKLYHSANMEMAKNKTFDDIYIACMPAAKWLANKDPVADLQTLESILAVLRTVRVKKRVFLISTVDVFESRVDMTGDEEEVRLDWAKHAYGRHRRRLEEAVVETFGHDATYIIRLPAVFGRGLKKNALYDLLNGNEENIAAICLKSKYQWYALDDLANDLKTMVVRGEHLSMPLGEPVEMKTIVESFFPEKSAKCKGQIPVIYAFSPTMSVSESKTVIAKMGCFIEAEKRRQALPFTVAASVIGIKYSTVGSSGSSPEESVFRHAGIEALEITPTITSEDLAKVSPTPLLNPPKTSYGMPVISMQGITYYMGPNFKLFRDYEKFLEYYGDLAKSLAAMPGAEQKRVVFGGPRTRDLNTTTTAEAVALFCRIGDISREHNILFCIEPNSSKYGCTWLTNLKDTLDFLQQVDHSHVRLNLDSGNYTLEADTHPIEDPAIQKWLGHVQISAGYLRLPMTEADRATAVRIIRHLKQIEYTGAISYEAMPMPEAGETYQDYCRGLWNFMDLIETA
jgi:sugar phosphate isomerase/epimerase